MEISNEVKVQILDNEIAALLQTQYLLETRYKVGKKVEADPEQMKTIKEQLVKIQMQIDETEAIKKELSKV